MVRWILLFFSLSCLGLMFFGPSMAWAMFGVAGFLLGSIATALAFAHARIDARARSDHDLHAEILSRRPPPPDAGTSVKDRPSPP